MQVILASVGQERDYDSESNNDQLDVNMLLNMESENEGLDSSQQIYSVTISEKPTAADFHVEI